MDAIEGRNETNGTNENSATNAKFMAESLLGHAREIRRYARTYCLPSPANLMVSEVHRATFRANVARMIREMCNLMLMAKKRGIAGHCNREQIEAFIVEAEEIIARPTEVRLAPAILN